MHTFGSEGDIRPFIALANELQIKGHDIQIVFTSIDNKKYDHLFELYGLDYHTVPDHVAITQERIKEIAGMKNLIKALKMTFRETFVPYENQMFEEALRLCNECDIVISHFSVYPMKVAVHKTNKPHIAVCFWPEMIQSEDRPLSKNNIFSSIGNPIVWKMLQLLFDTLLLKEMTPLWKRNNLKVPHHVMPDIWFSKDMTLVASSPSIWNKIVNQKIPAILSGFLELPKRDTEEIPFAVRNFIDDGDPPVYITFGSMFQIYPEESVLFFQKIIQQSKKRFIIQTKEPCASLSKQNVLCIQHSEHSAIFPYCQAVIHHGGAGTSQATCTAGCPSFIVAFNDEQFSWGKRLYEIGVAAAPMRFRNKRVENIIDFLEHITIDSSAKNASMQLSTQLKGEHGVKKAVETVERFIENRLYKC